MVCLIIPKSKVRKTFFFTTHCFVNVFQHYKAGFCINLLTIDAKLLKIVIVCKYI